MKTFASSTPDANKISGLGVFTLVLWVGCLLVGGLGVALPYTRPHPPQPQPEPVKAEMLDVKLTDDSPPAPEPADKSAIAEPNPLAQQIPQPIPVARPSPAIAFAIPVKGAVRIVPANQAAYTQPSSRPVVAAPTPQPLTFGEGEGRQPKPEYPQRAQRDGQEGAVTVRFTVAEDGHVVTVEAISPSRWPLLNESVLRAVKERWRFSPGKLRIYDVLIRFQLSQ
jgi:protein TonB